MLIAAGMVTLGIAGALVAALGRAASDTHHGWRLDEPVVEPTSGALLRRAV